MVTGHMRRCEVRSRGAFTPCIVAFTLPPSVPLPRRAASTQVVAVWKGVFVDHESGIDLVELCVVRAAEPQCIGAWRQVRDDSQSAVMSVPAELTANASAVAVLVRATNGAGLLASSLTNALEVDGAPPTLSSLSVQGLDGGGGPCVLSSADALHVRWESADEVSRDRMRYSLRYYVILSEIIARVCRAHILHVCPSHWPSPRPCTRHRAPLTHRARLTPGGFHSACPTCPGMI